MYVSVIAAGEFEVGQSFSDLPIASFRILPYNLVDALEAARLFKVHRQALLPLDRRPIILNDLKLIAQANMIGITAILSEDENTLSQMCSKLRVQGAVSTEALLLTDGFKPRELESPLQRELAFPAE